MMGRTEHLLIHLCLTFMILNETFGVIILPVKRENCTGTPLNQQSFLGGVPPANMILKNVTAISSLNCALLANRRRAMGYTYKEGICNLIGQGLAQHCFQELYEPVDFPEFDTLEEVAKEKPSYAVSTHSISYLPAFANDDNLQTIQVSLAAQNPYWYVDLEEQRQIYQIQIVPRVDGFWEWFKYTEIRIGTTTPSNGDFSSYTLMGYYEGPYSQDEGMLVFVDPVGITGQYVSIQYMYYSHIGLTDVKVFVKK